MKKIKIITVGILAAMAIIAIVYAGNTKQNRKSFTGEEKPVQNSVAVELDEDSVEVIGTPTNDDPWKEMVKLVKGYYAKNGIEYKGTMKVIDDNGEEEKTVEELPFEYMLLGNNFYYRLGNIEMVNKQKFILAVDNANKTILLAPQRASRIDTKLFDLRSFKKAMEGRNAHARVSQLGEEKILTIDNITDPSIQGYRIYYSPQTYRVSKMLIGMMRLTPLEQEEAPPAVPVPLVKDGIEAYYYYLEATFKSVQILNLKEKDFNPEHKFIIMSGKKVELTTDYIDYELSL